MFILSAERERDVSQAFANYSTYLKEHRAEFPPSAYALATSEWYFDPSVHQAPHDAWLESFSINERSSGARNEIRQTAITIKLLGAYHDAYIEFHYPCVFEYRTTIDVANGHGDWRYDEFRLDEQGRLVHEIEWATDRATASWLIVASDVQYTWNDGRV